MAIGCRLLAFGFWLMAFSVWLLVSLLLLAFAKSPSRPVALSPIRPVALSPILFKVSVVKKGAKVRAKGAEDQQRARRFFLELE